MRHGQPFRALCFVTFLAWRAGAAYAADPTLVDAAKKEGTVTWYTTQIVDQLARPAAEAFQQKYGIKVDFVRTDSSQLGIRLINEGQAGHVVADVFDSTTITLALKKQNLILKWLPDAAARLPKQFSDPDGYWMAASANVLTVGYNTNLVPSGSEPKRFEDLLDAKWKGKLVWGSTTSPSAAPGFIGTVLAAMGEKDGMDYLQKLAKQNITGLQQSARQVLDEVIAGEYPVALQIFNNHAVISATKGAPSAWAPLQASMAHLLVVSVTREAPHPNAGKLFEDFLTSPEGQQIFRDADYLTVDPAVPPKNPSLRLDEKNFHAIYFSPEELEQSMPKWVGVDKQLFQ
ncbi:MAG TPA: extracellular solute-binding protein [Beijerinckiaceae bacterium]|nr:extracellular solute-binding protein [Beijerinckiaceae bacterium]